MNSRSLWFGCFVLLSLALTSATGIALAAAKRPAKPSSEERSATFRWFPSLGYPDVKGRKFVCVSQNRPWHKANGPSDKTYGFLIEDDGNRIRVITLDLSTQTFFRNPPGLIRPGSAAYEAVDLAVFAADCLKQLRTHSENEVAELMSRLQIGLGRRAHVFVLAWACSRNGLDKMAAELFDAAAAMPGDFGADVEKTAKRPLRALVAAELAHFEMWRAVLSFGDPNVSRASLLKDFERIDKNFPDSEHHQRALQTVSLLRQMVKEDREHAATSQPFERLSKQQQVAELIFQLRDQNGHQWMQPGECDIFMCSG